MKIFSYLFIIVLVLNISSLSIANAKDIIKIANATSTIDNRFEYPEHILNLALKASVDKYGSFEIVNTPITSTRNRLLRLLQKGEHINVHNAPTKPEWEKKAIPIMFPLMKGLLNYRIFLIHEDNINKFKKVETIDDLKKLTAGLGTQWSTTKVLKMIGGFKMETGINYEGLFGMLNAKRFDYFIRGMNEVFREYEERKLRYPKIMIEPYIVMEVPLPWFFFVSPKNKRIAQRIEYGLQKIKADGSFDKEFYKYHGKAIKKANLHSRKLFKVKNMLLAPHEIYEDASYWLDITKFK